MKELLDKLQSAHGLSTEQAQGVLSTISDWVKEQFPMLGGAVDSLFGSGTQTSGGNPSDFIDTAGAANSAAKDKESGFYEGNKKDY
jgi:hypothetical protein